MHESSVWRRAGICAALFLLLALVAISFAGPLRNRIYVKMTGGRTIDDVVFEYGDGAESRFRPHFVAAQVAYPPKKVTLLADKTARTLAVYAQADDRWTHIHTYPILAASGKLGPKLREGDMQVPEGIYKIEGFNPNSAFHLSMKLNYPNDFDVGRAKEEKRYEPGSNIFIHGDAVSIGCLAMGDEAIEELFIMCAKVGADNISVVIAPTKPPLTPPEGAPVWTASLYARIERAWARIIP